MYFNTVFFSVYGNSAILNENEKNEELLLSLSEAGKPVIPVLYANSTENSNATESSESTVNTTGSTISNDTSTEETVSGTSVTSNLSTFMVILGCLWSFIFVHITH